MKASECRTLALDVREGLVFEEEVNRFLNNIYIVIKDYAKNGALSVGISYHQEINGGTGVYDIKIPLYTKREVAVVFLKNVFENVKGDLQLRGFSVSKIDFELLHKTKYHQCNYSLVVEW